MSVEVYNPFGWTVERLSKCRIARFQGVNFAMPNGMEQAGTNWKCTTAFKPGKLFPFAGANTAKEQWVKACEFLGLVEEPAGEGGWDRQVVKVADSGVFTNEVVRGLWCHQRDIGNSEYTVSLTFRVQKQFEYGSRRYDIGDTFEYKVPGKGVEALYAYSHSVTIVAAIMQRDGGYNFEEFGRASPK